MRFVRETGARERATQTGDVMVAGRQRSLSVYGERVVKFYERVPI